MTDHSVTILLRPDQAPEFVAGWRQASRDRDDALAALERCRRAWEKTQPQLPLDLYPED